MAHTQERLAFDPHQAPWRVEQGSVPVVISGAEIVAALSTGTLAGAYDWARIMSNARLIAAAPELLEALESVWNKVLTEYHSKASPVRQKVEAAMSKASVKWEFLKENVGD